MITQLRSDYEAQERARLEKVWAELDYETKQSYRWNFENYFTEHSYEQE